MKLLLDGSGLDKINSNLKFYSGVNVYQGSPNDYTDGKHNLATPDINFEYFEYIENSDNFDRFEHPNQFEDL